jgi:hypothetical protein
MKTHMTVHMTAHMMTTRMDDILINHKNVYTQDQEDLFNQRKKRKRYEQEHPTEKKPDREILYHEPHPMNTDPTCFQYVFGSSCSVDFFGSPYVEFESIIKTMRCGVPWEEARFLIEKRHGLFDVLQKKANLNGSYIQGFLWDPSFKNWRLQAKPIPKEYIMKFTDRVIVIVKPLPRGISAYVPEKYKAEIEVKQTELMSSEEKKREENIHKFIDYLKSAKLREATTEEDKINALVEQTESLMSFEQLKDKLLNKNRRLNVNLNVHPSDLEADVSKIKPPPPNYVCHRCGNPGHWKHLCKTLNDINFIPVTIPRVPTGIPKTLLREAKTDEERKHAMVTDDGRLVIMKQTSKLQPKMAKMQDLPDEFDFNDEDYVETPDQ